MDLPKKVLRNFPAEVAEKLTFQEIGPASNLESIFKYAALFLFLDGSAEVDSYSQLRQEDLRFFWGYKISVLEVLHCLAKLCFFGFDGCSQVPLKLLFARPDNFYLFPQRPRHGGIGDAQHPSDEAVPGFG